MALGDIEVAIVTLRFANGPAKQHVVAGKVAHIQARCDKAANGNGRVAVTDANTGHRFTIDLSEAETYTVKPGKLR